MFVKIIITDKDKVLHTKFIRINEWGIPSGKIEKNENPKDAAVRELKERTGCSIEPENLSFVKTQNNFMIFKGNAKDIIKIAEPGELGGYKTQIKWLNNI